MKTLSIFQAPSIRLRIASAFVIMTLFVLAMAVASYFQLRQVRPFSDAIIHNSSDLVNIQSLSAATSALDADLERFLLIQGAEYKDSVQTDLQDMTDSLALLQKDPIAGTETVLAELETTLAGLQGMIGLVLDPQSADMSSADTNRSIITIYKSIDQIKLQQKDLSAKTLSGLQTTAQTQGLIADNVLTQSVILGIIVSLIAIVTTIVTDRSLRTIGNLTNTAVAIAAGDLSRVAPVESNDEIGTLATSFNSMTAQLRTFIASLEQRVTDRTKALATSTEVSRRLSTILDQKELVNEVVNQVNDAFGYYHTQIYFYDETSNNLVMAGGTGEAGKLMLTQFHKIAKGRGLVGRAAEANEPILVADTAQNSDWLPNPLLPDTKSEVAIPIAIGDKVLGVLDVQHNIVDGLQREDIDALQSIANQIAVAIGNARSYDKVREAEKLTRNVIDATDDWIFIKDQDHRYQLVNQGYANSLHIPIADFIGKNDLELGFPEELVKGNPEKGIPGFWADDRSVMDGGVSKQIPDDLVTIDGNIHVFDTVKVPLRDADNKVWGVLAFARDMTERRNLEELNRKRATQQEAINQITQKIQGTTSIEMALQITARELGHALGMKSTQVTLEPEALANGQKSHRND